MTDRLEIQVPRPLTGVSALAGRAGDQAAPSASDGSSLRQQDGLDAELARLRRATEALEEAAVKFRDLQDRFCREAEEQLLNLSIEIARKVLMQEIQAGRHEIEPIVQEALSRVPARMDVVAHLHPDDLARCESARQQSEAAGPREISFVADPKVQPGGCLLQTSQGTIESSVEGQLEEIGNALKNPE